MNARTLLELFSSLVSLVYDTFSSLADNDLEELAHLTLKLWPKWLACVESNNREYFQTIFYNKYVLTTLHSSKIF